MERILIFCSYYLPGYLAGGPISTLKNVIAKMGVEFSFQLVTRDHDLGVNVPYPGVRQHKWNKVGHAQVRYLASADISFRTLLEIIREVDPDVLYLNSFFDPVFTQRVLGLRRLGLLRRTPVLLAPRGEFSTGALALKSVKKRAFMKVARAMGLYAGLAWQASSVHEADDIVRSFSVPRERIYVACDLVPGVARGESDVQALSAPVVASCKRDVPLRVCFLSRISPMKNLDFALGVLARLEVPAQFSIYGPIEDSMYWSGCQKVISSLPEYIEVSYKGSIEPTDVVAVLAQHDLFFFPTKGENFGHVIHEALRAGLPVLISDQTPWGRIESRGAGWVVSLSQPEVFAAHVAQVARASVEQRREWSAHARTLAADVSNDKGVVEANRRMFLDVISQRV